MPTFICFKCGCVDNTALGGNYWLINSEADFFKDEFANKNPLCVEFTPTEYSDGTPNEDSGKWHNKFPKRHWSEFGTREELILISKSVRETLIMRFNISQPWTRAQ